eukprot:6456493-Amphidinium_carterae.4
MRKKSRSTVQQVGQMWWKVVFRLLRTKCKWALSDGPTGAVVCTLLRIGWSMLDEVTLLTDEGCTIDLLRHSQTFVDKLLERATAKWVVGEESHDRTHWNAVQRSVKKARNRAEAWGIAATVTGGAWDQRKLQIESMQKCMEETAAHRVASARIASKVCTDRATIGKWCYPEVPEPAERTSAWGSLERVVHTDRSASHSSHPEIRRASWAAVSLDRHGQDYRLRERYAGEAASPFQCVGDAELLA